VLLAPRFSGVVVTYNEARRLPECLASLSFCEQLIVVDLGSSDGSVEIARAYNALVLSHAWVPIVEEVRSFGVAYARHEWIIFLDPDEVLPQVLVPEIVRIIEDQTDVSAIALPYRYFFMGRPLYHTRWGGRRWITRIFRKDKLIVSRHVHRGLGVLSGEIAKVPFSEEKAIRHYWVDSWRQLFEKHWRYIIREGQARYEVGQRFSWRAAIRDVLRSFKACLIEDGGIRGGPTGIFLSLFWAWYVGMAWVSLLQYERTSQRC
jgi:glycosyltransferase involved in cell wall biosynthesis